MIEPRGWQVTSLERFMSHDSLCYLQEATPGAGKTIFSALCMSHLLTEGKIDFIVCVVPTKALKGDSSSGFLGDYAKVNIQITTTLKEGRDRPRNWQGAVITYQQLPNLVATFEIWRNKGCRLGFVFDEIHHASEHNHWGAAAESCNENAVRILAMTGTPFRADNKKISFVRYGEDGVCIPDHSVNYRAAVAAGICRPVTFFHDDGVASYLLKELTETRISDASEDDIGNVSRTVFEPGSEFLTNVLMRADTALDEYRIADSDAGGLVVCRPGFDDNDDRHLIKVANMVRRLSGTRPTVITHDDPDAIAKLEAFRRSGEKWIVAVRMISEGVDIKRLRVLVMASAPRTELLFRQLVGRVVRQEQSERYEDASVFIAKFPHLEEYASRISEEAKAGVRERAPRQRTNGEGDGFEEGLFQSLGATHEPGGAVSDFGEKFTAEEITYAERFRRGDAQLANAPIAMVAHIFRRAGITPHPEEPPEEPKHARVTRKRGELNNLVRRLAFRCRGEDGKPPFADIHTNLGKRLGYRDINDLIDNKSEDCLDQAIALATKWLEAGVDG